MEVKESDWCFCEFKLSQIKRVETNGIVEVSDGHFTMSGQLADRCFPLDMRVKTISDSVKYWSDEIHNLKNNALNYPDIHQELIKYWVEMCESRNDDNRLKFLYDKLDKFGTALKQRIHDLQYEEVEGVRLFRPS